MPALTNRLVGVFAIALMLGCAGKTAPAPVSSPTEAGEETRELNQLVSVTTEERENATAVILEGTAPMSPNIFKLTDPDRIIVDLTDTKLGDVSAAEDINAGGISEITSNQFDDAKSSLSRVVIALSEPMEYQVESDGAKLVLTVSGSVGGVEGAEAGLPELPELAGLPSEMEEDVTSPAEEEFVAPEGEEIVADEGAGVVAVAPAPMEGEESIAANQLLDIQYGSSDAGTTVRLLGNGSIESYEDFILSDPARVVIDLMGVENAYPGDTTIQLGTTEVATVRLGAQDGSVRVVLDHARSDTPSYSITRDGNALVLNIANIGPMEPGADTAMQVEASEEEYIPEEAVDAGVAMAPPTVPGAPVMVTGLGFKQMKEQQKSRLIIGVSDPYVEYSTHEPGPGKFVVTIANSRLEKSSLKREFDTREFQTAILSVSPRADRSTGSTEFVVELEQQVPYTVTQDGTNLYVDVDIPPQIYRKQTSTIAEGGAPAPLPPTEEGEMPIDAASIPEEALPTTVSGKVPELLMSSEEITPVEDGDIKGPKGVKPRDYRYVKEEFMSESMASGEPLTAMGAILAGDYEGRKFQGRKISLDFKDADVRSIFRLIAEISKFNMIISDDVEGRITLRLDDVPWDQAFAIILQTRGLWFERYGNIVRIAPAEKLRREREMAAAALRAAKAAKPLDVLFKPVSFAEAGTLTKQVQSVLSERGTVDIDSRTNTLIIKDIRENLNKAKRMVEILDTQTPQVTIESRIVEATTTFTRSFGITWGGNARFTAATGNPTGIFFPNSVAVSPFAMNFPVEAGFINSTATIKMGSINNIVDLDLNLALGEQEGHAKLISAPKVTVLDNKSATITAGSKIPFLTQTANAGSNVRFESAATTLTVTPHITNDGAILMRINATRSQPNFAQLVQGNPLIDTRQAQTEVLVKSGNTTVLGGIYSTQTGRSQSRFPYISKIPILGALFRNYDKQLRRTELLIFVTPRIVGDEREAVRDIRD